MKRIVLLFVFFTSLLGFSQETEKVYKLSEVETAPESPSSLNEFKKCLIINLALPEIEQGGVFNLELSFVVEKNGSLSEPKLVNDPGFGFNNAVIKAFTACAAKQRRWKPGKLKGEKVRTLVVFPLTVKID